MGATPDQLWQEAEATRAQLARNADRLAERVQPSRVAHRKAHATRRRLTSVKERVMGSAHDAKTTVLAGAQSGGERAQEAAYGGKDHVQEGAHTGRERMQEAARQAPDEVLSRTQGNPLAAGLVAFGAGLLVGSLMPATSAEERVGRQMREHSDELVQPVREVAQESAQGIKEEMREPVSQAADSVRGTAQEAARTAEEHGLESGRETAEQVQASGRRVAQETRGQTRGSA